jgi:hypothetical protein
MVGLLLNNAAGWTFVVAKKSAVQDAASPIVVFANHGCTLLICNRHATVSSRDLVLPTKVKGTHAIVGLLQDEGVEVRAGLGVPDLDCLWQVEACERRTHVGDVGDQHRGARVRDVAVRTDTPIRGHVAATPSAPAWSPTA